MASKKSKSAILAGVISIILPGVGHAYLGKWRRGLLWIAGFLGFVVAQRLLSPVELNNISTLLVTSIIAFDAIITTQELSGKTVYQARETKFLRILLVLYGVVGAISYFGVFYPGLLEGYYANLPAFYYPYWAVSAIVFLSSIVATYKLKKIGAFVLLGVSALDILTSLYLERFAIEASAETINVSLLINLFVLFVVFSVVRRRWALFS